MSTATAAATTTATTTATTVALRGTLHRDESSTTGGGWQWRGVWAFGISVSPSVPQQPFAYTFQGPTNPEDIEIPGILMGETEDHPNEDGTEIAQAERGDVESTTNASMVPTESPIGKDPPNTPFDAPKEESKTPTKTTDDKTTKEEVNEGEGKDFSQKNPISRNPTYATVPDGHPPFTEACLLYPDKPCPPSGRWKGHFQNNSINARPRDKMERVQETFYLFFNATPGPQVTFSFDETQPLLPPSNVSPDQLVLVRGMGSNPFGTFEIIGYLDLTEGVMEIQRQYVLMPVKKRIRRSSTSAAGNNNNNKSYSTRRKRQPSWKRKSLEDGEEEPTPKRQRKQSIGAAWTIAGGSAPLVAGGGGDGSSRLVGSDGRWIVPGSTDATEAERTSSFVGMSSVKATTTTFIPLFGPTTGSDAMGPPPPPSHPTTSVPWSGTKSSSKTPRKRSGSGSSIKSTTSSISASPSMSTSSGTSPHLKLPPVGEPKKARWRAAHFLYYQRNDPDDEEVKTPKYVVYEGEMANSMREGRGICLFSNGLLYEGQWKRNKEHGLGQLWTADRRRLIYDGSWERGRMQGQGTYYYGNGTSNAVTPGASNPHGSQAGARYTGEFKENMRHGLGHYVLPDGSEYHGMWSQGKMNGRGVFTWPDQSVYDGDFKDGERNGQGILNTSDGFTYDGTWVQNAMEGRGIARYPNGQTFEGLFSNGRREGRGTMRFTNGAIYEGRFRDDAVDGQGTMKISRSLIIPNSHEEEEKPIGDDDNDTSSHPSTTAHRSDFMIPISFQSDLTHIHAKAGFTPIGD